MKVILREDVENLGIIGDMVDVAAGYARNYLIPRNLAVPANAGNAAVIEHHQRAIAKKREVAIQAAKSLAEQVKGIELTIEASVGEAGKLFGAVTSMDIADAATKHGLALDRKQVVLHDPIKQVGEYMVKVKLGTGISGEIKVTVKSDKPPEPETPAETETPAEAAAS